MSRPQHLLLGQGAQRSVDRLDQQSRSLARRKSPRESFDQPHRVLALDRAQVVEDEQEQEALGDSEAHRSCGLRRGLDGRWQGDHGDGRHGADVLGHEAGVDPDLIDQREGTLPARWDAVGLPAPDPDAWTLEVVLPEALHEARQLIGVHRNQVEPVAPLVDQLLEAVLSVVAGQLLRSHEVVQWHAHRAHRHPCGRERLHISARGRPQTQGVAEVAGYAHRRGATRRGGRRRTTLAAGRRVPLVLRAPAHPLRWGRHEMRGYRELPIPKGPAPGHVLRPVLPVQVGVGAQHIGPLRGHPVEHVAVDPVSATLWGRPLQPLGERPRPLGTEQLAELLPQPAGARIQRIQPLVVDEPVGEPAADLETPACILPARLAQLRGVADAQIAKRRRAADPHATGPWSQTVGTVGFEAGEVQEPRRAIPVDEHARGIVLELERVQVPHAQIAPWILQHSGGEARRRQLEQAREPRPILRPGATPTAVDRSNRVFDMGTPPGEKALCARRAVGGDQRVVDPSEPAHLAGLRFQAVVGHVGEHPRYEQHAVDSQRSLDRRQRADDPHRGRQMHDGTAAAPRIQAKQARQQQDRQLVLVVAGDQALHVEVQLRRSRAHRERLVG